MKLILQKDVKNLGKTGDQVVVKKGYARNFLLPKNLALTVNKTRLKYWNHQSFVIESKKKQAETSRKLLIKKISTLQIKFEKESLKNGKLFGSVNAFEISQYLEKTHKVLIDKKDITPTNLKQVGDHKITIQLDPNHKTEMLVQITGKITSKSNSQEELSQYQTQETAQVKKDQDKTQEAVQVKKDQDSDQANATQVKKDQDKDLLQKKS